MSSNYGGDFFVSLSARNIRNNNFSGVVVVMVAVGALAGRSRGHSLK